MAGSLTDAYESVLLSILLEGTASSRQNANILSNERQLGLLTAFGDLEAGSGVQIADSTATAQAQGRAPGYLPYNYVAGLQGNSEIWQISTPVGGATAYTNVVPITFTNLPACTVVGWFLYDGGGGGVLRGLILEGAFAGAVAVPQGGTFYIPAGTLVVTLD